VLDFLLEADVEPLEDRRPVEPGRVGRAADEDAHLVGRGVLMAVVGHPPVGSGTGEEILLFDVAKGIKVKGAGPERAAGP
jgi:hypothetical protein